MTIEVQDEDYARLTKLAEQRGEPDVSRLVCDVLSSYLDDQERERALEALQGAKKESRWAEVARRHRENPTLTGKAEEVNGLIHEFRREFAV